MKNALRYFIGMFVIFGGSTFYQAMAWCWETKKTSYHYNDVIMDSMTSQITSLTIVYSAVYSDADQRKHQSSASLAFVRGIHRGPVNSPHKGPVTRKMFPFDDVIMDSMLTRNEAWRLEAARWVYHPGNHLSCKRVSATLFKIWQPRMKSTSAQSLDGLQRLDLQISPQIKCLIMVAKVTCPIMIPYCILPS